MFFKKRKPMWILIISLIVLALVAATAGIIRNRKLQKKIDRGELDAMPEVQEVNSECCGQHEICERDIYSLRDASFRCRHRSGRT